MITEPNFGCNEYADNQFVVAESNFGLSDYKDSTGRTLPMYVLTKKGELELDVIISCI